MVHRRRCEEARGGGGRGGGRATSRPARPPRLPASSLASETNVCYNCVDRHIEAGAGDTAAFYWEGNDEGTDSTMTYAQLHAAVGRAANWLRSAGVKKGDDVTLYMPMVPELPVAMLACARIGAVHSVVFAGFSADALAARIADSKSAVVITAAAVRRGAKPIPLKSVVDAACAKCAADGGHAVASVLVLDKPEAMPRSAVPMQAGRDAWWDEAMVGQSADAAVEWVGAEDPLFKLYTSGSTGKPKGVVHTTAGYMVGTATTFKAVFDYRVGGGASGAGGKKGDAKEKETDAPTSTTPLPPQPDDVYWCTADCGWITGHSYVTYGPLLHRATQVLFEGVPTHPDAGRMWAIVDKYKVAQLYTAPTAIRALEACGDDWVTKAGRSSLRVLGSVGEPIGPVAWAWYHDVVGGSRCPIVDTWWQTETGAHMLTPLPAATPLKPGSATLPFFGVEPALLDEHGKEIEGEGEGVLVIKRSWPSALRTLAGDADRFEATYFAPYPGYYFSGDGARRDADGYYWCVEGGVGGGGWEGGRGGGRARARRVSLGGPFPTPHTSLSPPPKGSSGASTTSSTCQATASARPRWRARSRSTPRAPRRRSCRSTTRSKGKASTRT